MAFLMNILRKTTACLRDISSGMEKESEEVRKAEEARVEQLKEHLQRREDLKVFLRKALAEETDNARSLELAKELTDTFLFIQLLEKELARSPLHAKKK